MLARLVHPELVEGLLPLRNFNEGLLVYLTTLLTNIIKLNKSVSAGIDNCQRIHSRLVKDVRIFYYNRPDTILFVNNKKLFIYFDVGGVLVDWSKAFETAASRFDLTVDDIGKVFDENNLKITKGFITPQQLWERCIKKYNIPNAHNYDFLESWVSDYKPIQEIHSFVHKIKSTYKIGLLSNIYKGMEPILLEKEIIPTIHYQEIVFSCDVGMRKPEDKVYEFAQKKAQIEQDNILLIDDREDYLEGAKKARWKTFLFDNQLRSKSIKELEKYIKSF